MTTGALSGITVLDLSRLLPGPYCSMILADHGARVIAIEDKRFIAESVFPTIVKRNKEHITLNLKSEEGKEIFSRLAKDADIILEGFRPGVVDKLGVSYNNIKKINPKIIYCSITGYGQNGPLVNRVGHDVNYLSVSGALDLIGEPGCPPCIPGFQIADIAGGGMNAVIGILLALHAREKTGKGQYIDISMTDGVLSLMALPLNFQQVFGQSATRSESLLSHRFACYNTYETSDGRFLSIGAVEHRFWKNLCEYLGADEYTDFQYDETKREEIIDFMRKTFKKKTLAEWEDDLADKNVCWGPIRNLTEVQEDQLFREREMITEIEEKDGKKNLTIGIPVKLSDNPGSIRTPPVGFGESTASVLSEFGYSKEEIEKFSKNGTT